MHTHFTTYDDVLAHLDQRGLFHMDFGLERIGNILTALNVQRPPYAVIQVIGTNGKGSTSTFLASLAKAHGLRVGLYTSPHFITPRERIRIDGAMLKESAWPRLANTIFASGGESLTYFEFLTVLAALAFAEAGVDVAIMEAGLGGSWDGTTAMAADLLCVTPIGLDHQAVLGNTLEEIAQDKAGAMRQGQTVFMAPQEDKVLLKFLEKSNARDAWLMMVDPNARPSLTYTPLPTLFPPMLEPTLVPTIPSTTPLGLHGPHQYNNASVAVRAWEYLAHERAWPVHEVAVLEGLASARIAGRYDTIKTPQFPCPIILDGAHNPHGLQGLDHAIHHDGVKPRAVIFACLADKDLDSLIPLLLHMAQGAELFIPTIQHNERALDGAVLAERINKQIQALKKSSSPTNSTSHAPQSTSHATAVPLIADALALASELSPKDTSSPIVLCGSLYLLAEFFTMYPESLE